MTHDTDPTLSISEQAAHWWVVFHSEGASAADHREFADWVARSPERVAAYLETAQLHHGLQSRDLRWPSTPAQTLIDEARAAPPDAVPLSRRPSEPRQERRRVITSRAAGFALAASLLMSAGLAWFALSRPQQFETKFGEQRSVLLADGSRVTLNTASRIEVHHDKHRRRVDLLQGEALFEVAHDPARPFDVETGGAVVRAVGTQFNVDVRPTQTTVTVVEGLVAVTADNQSAALPTLAAADRLVINRSGPHALERGVNVAAAISWTQHRLMFDRRPLGEVADEFNRYNRERIEVVSAELRQMEISGVFQSNDAASFIAFLSGIPHVQVRNASGQHIVTLDSATAPPAQ